MREEKTVSTSQLPAVNASHVKVGSFSQGNAATASQLNEATASQALQDLDKKNGKPVHHRAETLEMRKKILAAATVIFGRKGIEKATLEDVSNEVGMTRAGILHYFGSKRRLLLEVLNYRDEQDVHDRPDEHMPRGIDGFLHLIKTAFINEQRPGVTRAYVVLSAEAVTEDNPGREFFRRRYAWLRNELQEDLLLECEKRGITVDDAQKARIDAACAGVLALMDGLQLQWALQDDAIELASMTKKGIEALIYPVLHPLAGEESEL